GVFIAIPQFTSLTVFRSYLTCLFFFFFNTTATSEIYTLSLHDALPILGGAGDVVAQQRGPGRTAEGHLRRYHLVPGLASGLLGEDRKSTRLNSSHVSISYAVFCLKKKNK